MNSRKTRKFFKGIGIAGAAMGILVAVGELIFACSKDIRTEEEIMYDLLEEKQKEANEEAEN